MLRATWPDFTFFWNAVCKVKCVSAKYRNKGNDSQIRWASGGTPGHTSEIPSFGDSSPRMGEPCKDGERLANRLGDARYALESAALLRAKTLSGGAFAFPEFGLCLLMSDCGGVSVRLDIGVIFSMLSALSCFTGGDAGGWMAIWICSFIFALRFLGRSFSVAEPAFSCTYMDRSLTLWLYCDKANHRHASLLSRYEYASQVLVFWNLSIPYGEEYCLSHLTSKSLCAHLRGRDSGGQQVS